MPKPKFMLHVCCAPCSTHVLDLLSPAFEITGFFYNPNIHPRKEYELRRDEAQRYFGERNTTLLIPAYRPRDWFSLIRGHGREPEGGERCALCFHMRLEETACAASSRGFTHFGSTLSISPHKDARSINRIGAEIGSHYGPRFYAADFKKKNGYKKSCELSRMHDLYRQNYCGCIFSYMIKTGA